MLHHQSSAQWKDYQNLPEENSSFLVLTDGSPAALQLVEVPSKIVIQSVFRMTCLFY